MDLVPSLQQYCYELLAEYSGYIEDLSGVYVTGILEICSRSNTFGLANIEKLAETSELDTDLIWEQIYNQNPERFKCENEDLIRGRGFHRNVILSCEIRNQIKSNDMDDEDLQKFLSLVSQIKLLELKSFLRLTPSIILSQFSNLLQLNLSDSKLGPSVSNDIHELILRNPCLIFLNLNNVMLTDSGVTPLLDPINNSKIVTLILSWNDLTLKLITLVFTMVKTHKFISILNLSNNIKRQDIIAYTKAKNEVIKLKNIKIT